MNGVAVILLVISLAILLAGILALFYLIKKFKRSVITKGDLKSHSTESAKRLGFTLWPVILLKTDSIGVIANTIPFLRIILINITALEKLNKNEQFAAIDHEKGHMKKLKEDFFIYFYLISPVPFITYSILLPISNFKSWLATIPLFFIFLIIRFFKLDYVINLKIKSELGADRISAELGNSETLISGLKKAEKYIKEISPPKILVLLSNVYFAKRPFYPSIDERIKKLEEFSQKQSNLERHLSTKSSVV